MLCRAQLSCVELHFHLEPEFEAEAEEQVAEGGEAAAPAHGFAPEAGAGAEAGIGDAAEGADAEAGDMEWERLRSVATAGVYARGEDAEWCCSARERRTVAAVRRWAAAAGECHRLRAMLRMP